MEVKCICSFRINSVFKTCINCGYTEKAPLESTFETSSYNQTHSPFYSGYSRNKRFKLLVAQLLFPSPNKADDDMLQYFTENKLHPLCAEIEDTYANLS